MLTAATTTINGKEEARVDWPRTDSALEAFLDLLEWQIWAALRGHTYWASLYQERWHYGTLSGYSSVPRYSAPERGAVRLAVRTISMIVNLPPECPPNPVKEYAHPVPDVLPSNWVNVVNDILCYGERRLQEDRRAAGRRHRGARLPAASDLPAAAARLGLHPQS